MITTKVLEQQGFRQYPASKGDALYHKWITSQGKRLFALNLILWKSPEDEQFSAEARLYQSTKYHRPLTHTGEPETSFDVDLIVGPETTLDDVEAFFVRAYTALDCIPDPHNQN